MKVSDICLCCKGREMCESYVNEQGERIDDCPVQMECKEFLKKLHKAEPFELNDILKEDY